MPTFYRTITASDWMQLMTKVANNKDLDAETKKNW